MTEDPRTAVAFNLELGGRHAASARVELLDGPDAARTARVALRGWIDGPAERRLERALDAFAPRAVTRVVLDCSRVRRIAGRQAARLVAAMARLESGHGSIEVCGLPPGIGGALDGGSRVRYWPSTGESSERRPPESAGEAAS
jgi:hypothetical protein